MLAEFNLQAKFRRNQPKYHYVVAQFGMEQKVYGPYPGYTLQQLWDAAEHYI